MPYNFIKGVMVLTIVCCFKESQWQCSCQEDTTTRHMLGIAHGDPAPPLLAPYACRLHVVPDNSHTAVICSGVLVEYHNVKVLLTAAHCFLFGSKETVKKLGAKYLDTRSSRYFNLFQSPEAKLDIACGSHAKEAAIELNAQHLHNNVRIHKGFPAGAAPQYDIAVVHFSSDERVHQVINGFVDRGHWKFWSHAESYYNPKENVKCEIIGFGRTHPDFTQTSDTPRAGVLKVCSYAYACHGVRCEWWLRGRKYPPICLVPLYNAAPPEEGLALQGDSGGPVFCKLSDGSAHLTGIVCMSSIEGKSSSRPTTTVTPLWHASLMSSFLAPAVVETGRNTNETLRTKL